MLIVVQADSEERIHEVAALFREYGAIPGIEVCLATFDEESAGLPGIYAPPAGRLLLALDEGRSAGCVGIARLDAGVCEMRRLYVRPSFRGLRAGRSLAEAAMAQAARMGYRTMRLETLPDLMKEAVALYRGLGFREIDPYGGTRKAGALYMERALP